MKRYLTMAVVMITAILLGVGMVHAITVVDVDTSDLNRIMSTSPSPVDPISAVFTIWEDYDEVGLTPYPSHDGLAIINPDPGVNPTTGARYSGWFDKIFTIDQFYLNPSLIFVVENTTPYVWSDYHFEFWDPEFQNRNTFIPSLLAGWSADIFRNSALNLGGDTLEFWAPGWQAPGDVQTFTLNFEFLEPGQFGIRQVATTVPEPATMLLLGMGLIGLAGARRKLKS